MARKLVSIACAIAVLAIGALVGSFVSTPHSAGAAERLKAFSPDRDGVENTVNVRPKEERHSLGDYLVGTSPLLNRPGGKQIGNEKHACYELGGTENSFSALCTVTAWIEGRGKIVASGAFKAVFSRQGQRNAATLAIVGGTGAFRDARGTLQLQFKRHGATFVFNVLD